MALEPTGGNDANRQLWARAVARSALGTLNLVVGGTGLVAAAALHSGPLLSLGLLAYAALVAWDLASPKTWREAARPEAETAPEITMPSPGSLRDPLLQQAARSLLSAHDELERVMRESPKAIARYLDLSLTSAVELDERAARLVLRGEEIYRYLASQDVGRVRDEIQRLQAQANRTQDATAREQFQQAKVSREQQLATLQELVDALDRVHANLSRILATAEGLPARVMHMRALDGQAIDAMSGDVNQELDRMNQEVAAFEDTLKSLSVQVPA